MYSQEFFSKTHNAKLGGEKAFKQICFVGGLSSPYFIVISETRFYPVEAILILIAFGFGLLSRNVERLNSKIFLIFMAWTTGLVIASVANSVESTKILIGIANITFFVTSLICLIAIASANGLVAFTYGFSIGGIVFTLTPMGAELARAGVWKFGFAIPLLILTLIYSRKGNKTVFFASTVTIIGFISLLQSFRSLSFLSLVTVLVLVSSYLRQRATKRSLFFVSFGLLLSVGVFVRLYSYLADANLLSSTDTQKFYTQDTAPGGFLVGSRVNVLITLEAALKSPLLGHGSYTSIDPVVLSQSSLFRFSEQKSLILVDYFRPHTAIFGTWYQAGILGLLAWILLLSIIVRLWKKSELPVYVYTPILILISIAIVFSPLAANNRLSLALLISLLAIRDSNIEKKNPNISLKEK